MLVLDMFCICMIVEYQDQFYVSCRAFNCFSSSFDSYLDFAFHLQSIGSLQKKYSIGSFELLSKTAPIQALSLIFFGPFIDYYLNGKSIVKYKFTSGVIVCRLSTLISLHLILGFSFSVDAESNILTDVCSSSSSSLVHLPCSATSASISV